MVLELVWVWCGSSVGVVGDMGVVGMVRLWCDEGVVCGVGVMWCEGKCSVVCDVE